MEFKVEYIEQYCNELKLNKVGDFNNMSIEHVPFYSFNNLHVFENTV